MIENFYGNYRKTVEVFLTIIEMYPHVMEYFFFIKNYEIILTS